MRRSSSSSKEEQHIKEGKRERRSSSNSKEQKRQKANEDQEMINLMMTLPPEIIKNIGEFIPDVKDLSMFRASQSYVYKNINTPISSNTSRILSSDRLIKKGVKEVVRVLIENSKKYVIAKEKMEVDDDYSKFTLQHILQFINTVIATGHASIESQISNVLKNLFRNVCDEVKMIDDPYTKVKDVLYIVKGPPKTVISESMIHSAFSETFLEMLMIKHTFTNRIEVLEEAFWDFLREIFANTINREHFAIINQWEFGAYRKRLDYVFDEQFSDPFKIVSKLHPAFNYEKYVNDFEFIFMEDDD